MKRRLLSFALLAVQACSSTSEVEPGSPARPGPDGVCEEAATKCEGVLVSTCGGGGWSAPVECPGNQSCRENVCDDPTPEMESQAQAVAKLVEDLGDSTAWHEPVDAAALKERETRSILKGDGTDRPYFAAAWRVMNAFPQGHQSLFSSDPAVCGGALPNQHASRFGVCGRPTKDGIAVVFAPAANKLGLAKGDVVVKAGAVEGAAIADDAYAHATCGSTFPAASGRRTSGAASFFGVVDAGAKLTVRAPDGTTREVTVPAESDPRATTCLETFGRSRAIYAEATTRPDGVAVIRLPSFFPYDKSPPNTNDPVAFQQFIDDYSAEILAVFDTVKTAPGIVWDVRGNTGGITTVGLAIVAGFSSARPTSLSYCRYRSPGAALLADEYAVYGVTPGGPFAYAGKVAVVADGLAYSAGDYFPYAVLRASDVPVVGTSTAGAFGGAGGTLPIAGPPSLSAVFDPNRCFDATTNTPLEGNVLPPTIAVDYDPMDLAQDRDTLLERAVTSLGL